ncbi:MAG: hypothetical protein MPK62_02225 [Alphaproteobacteria bacterium]|nr:hypothetical protein [Alphaproteobacteria bacterium]MDA8029951.1 hypothetical protein [Alphaproteobacteria bacterium]
MRDDHVSLTDLPQSFQDEIKAIVRSIIPSASHFYMLSGPRTDDPYLFTFLSDVGKVSESKEPELRRAGFVVHHTSRLFSSRANRTVNYWTVSLGHKRRLNAARHLKK